MKRLKCNHKLSPGRVCGQMFSTTYQLSKHRKDASHQVKRKRRTSTAAASLLLETINPLGDMSDDKGDDTPGDMSDDGDTVDPPGDTSGDGDTVDPPGDMSDDRDTVDPPGDMFGDQRPSQTPAETSGPPGGNSSITIAHASGEEPEKCIICELGEDEDEDEEVWIECTQCYRRIHESCLILILNYPYSSKNDDFLCPECYRQKEDHNDLSNQFQCVLFNNTLMNLRFLHSNT